MAALAASLATALLCGCGSSEENPEPDPAEPLAGAPAEETPKPAAPKPADPSSLSPFDRPPSEPAPAPKASEKAAPEPQRPRAFVTGIIEALDEDFMTLNKERLPMVTPALARDLKVGDFIMARLDTGRVIAIEKLMKPQVTRSDEPPEPPQVGDVILIDRVRGKVLAADKKGVTIRVIEGQRYIGKTRVPLLPTTVITVLESSGVPKRKKKTLTLAPEPKPAASGFPVDGPLASCIFEVDPEAKGAVKKLRIEGLGGIIKDGAYIISLRVHNDDVRALSKYEVALDFKETNGYSFGTINVAKKEEFIEAGSSRCINITAKPLLLGPCQGVRLLLSRPQFAEPGGER